MIKNILRHKYLFLITLLFVVYLPFSVGIPAQTNTRAIVTGISIDKKNDNFTVALQIITPQSNISNNENLDIIEDDGKTVFDCLNNLSIKLGKEIGLEHTNIIILSDSIKEEDLMNIFEYMYRNSKITLSTILVYTTGSAKNLLETSAELNNHSSSSIQNNLGFNSKLFLTANVVTLGDFFNDYYSFSAITSMPLISQGISGDSQGGQEGSSDTQQSGSSGGVVGASSGGSSNSGSETKVEPLVQNEGKSAIFKKGKFFDELSKELVTGFSYLNKKSYKGAIFVENVTDKYYDNSKVSVEIEKSKIKIKEVYRDNKLCLDVDFRIYCYLSEVINERPKDIKIMYSIENYLTEALTDKLKEKINDSVQKSLEYTKNQKIDIFQFYEKFYKHDKKSLIKILRQYGEDYLDACEINMNISVLPYK